MDKKYIDTQGSKPCNIGGQAVIEGIMMRGKNMYSLAVRNQDGGIELDNKEIKPLSTKYKFFGIPIIRGVVAFIDSLVLGVKIIAKSVEMSGLEEGEPGRFEQFLERKFGDKLNKVIMGFVMVVSLALSVGLFMILPVFLGSLFNRIPFVYNNTWILGILEGFIRLFLFMLYIFLISKSKDMQRTFQYHGAEHKAINCYEHEEELVVENVKKYSRLHRRCGTSFLLFVMLISMIFFLFVSTNTLLMRVATRVLFVPLIAGLSYEVLKLAGRSQSKIVEILSKPGIALQKMTTKEPDDLQIECAIVAMQEVLKSEE
ncbi:MAG: DUF1385 domain-containing protein [Defluviitaleaceae bacterium]|nr:DUF1385 domain-containing protein [Defluviitaleaceae bacterium]